MLIIAIAPLPYGYYTLLRLVSCAVFSWACFAAISRQQAPLGVVLGIAAALFNPLIPVHLEKEVWVVLDAAGAALSLGTALLLRERTA